MPENGDRFRVINLKIPIGIEKIRLDKYIGNDPGLKITRRKIQKLIEAGLIYVDGIPAKHNHPLVGGEEVLIKISPPRESEVKPENIPLDIVHEDEFLLVVNKPAGMVTHPAPGNYEGTLVNALRYYSSELSSGYGIDRPGIVHRLDKNTSGLIIVAKNDDVHVALQQALREQRIRKIYQVLVCGHMKDESGSVDLPVGRSIKDRRRMTVTRYKGRAARTEYRLVDRYKLHDLLEVNLKTGRTHQIRVHFSFLGHPVFGDPDYGGRTKWHRGIFAIDKQVAVEALKIMGRQALHAGKLEFFHPVSEDLISLSCELPGDFRRLLDFMDRKWR